MTARALAALDVLAAFAEASGASSLHETRAARWRRARDRSGAPPGDRSIIDEPFVPNSIYLNNSTDRLLIITGPNMGGKSTVLRQTAIICILAQTGASFLLSARACRYWIASGRGLARQTISRAAVRRSWSR